MRPLGRRRRALVGRSVRARGRDSGHGGRNLVRTRTQRQHSCPGLVEYLRRNAFYNSVRGSRETGRGHEPLEELSADLSRRGHRAVSPIERHGLYRLCACIRLGANVSRLFRVRGPCSPSTAPLSRLWSLPCSGSRPLALGSARAAPRLLALAVIADFNEVPLPDGMRFDAGLPLALITLAVARPAAGDPRRPGPDRRRRARPRRADRAPRQPGQPRRLRLGGGRRRAAARAVGATALGRRRCPGSARRRGDVRRQLLGRPRHLPAAVLGHPPPPAADVRRRPCPTALAMVLLAALTIVLVARSACSRSRLRADRRAAAERADLRRAHAPGRPAGPADRDAPLRARAGPASRAQTARSAGTSRASPSSPSRAATKPATRSPTPARRCATRAARAGRPATSASGGTAAAAPPACAAPSRR